MFPDYAGPVRLEDCARHGTGSGSELLIVEGLSAAQAVLAVRDPEVQAVLPMQGKPMNAAIAKKQQVLRNPLFQALMSAVEEMSPSEQLPAEELGDAAECTAQSLQSTVDRPGSVRYERLVLLCDPDADGIHCGALLLIFIQRYLNAWLHSGRVCQIRPPAAKVEWIDTLGKSHFALSPSVEHSIQLVQQLQLAGYQSIRRNQYRGLAGIDQAILKRYCIATETRHQHPLTEQDAELALKYFGK